MSAADGPVDLESWRFTHDRRTRARWVDRLPDDIKSEILASDAGATIITRWLRDVHGYQDATVNRVAALIRDRQGDG